LVDGKTGKVLKVSLDDDSNGQHWKREGVNSKPGAIPRHSFDTMKILIIEDDKETRDYVSAGLKEAGHTIDSARDGFEGCSLRKRENMTCLLSIECCRPWWTYLGETLRSAGCNVPVLFLTTMCGLMIVLKAWMQGADDYLIKPFAFSELGARVNALLAQAKGNSEQKVLQVSGLEIDLLKRVVRRSGTNHRIFNQLSSVCLSILSAMLDRSSLAPCCLKTSGFSFWSQNQYVETHISRLRGKLNAGNKSISFIPCVAQIYDSWSCLVLPVPSVLNSQLYICCFFYVPFCPIGIGRLLLTNHTLEQQLKTASKRKPSGWKPNMIQAD